LHARGAADRGEGVRRQHGRSSTLRAQVEKVKDRFAISRMVLVGDRGMITSARSATI
jgi:hypothetical protein